MSRDDRRDMLVFLGFLVTCAVVVAVVFIAKNLWTGAQWAALGGFGSLLQALAVTAALPFALWQIREARANEDRRRRADLVDRLDVAYLRLRDAADNQQGAWNAVVYYSRGVFESEAFLHLRGRNPEAADDHRQDEYREAREQFAAARQEFRTCARAIDRTLLALGHEGATLRYLIKSAPHFGPFYVPFDPNEVTTELAAENYDRLKPILSELEKFVEQALVERSPRLDNAS